MPENKQNFDKSSTDGVEHVSVSDVAEVLGNGAMISKMSPTDDDNKSVQSLTACKWDATNWDLNVQQPHGGQEWAGMGAKFVEDFSVTTNFMGPPWRAVASCSAALQHIEHYPAANCEPALSDLAAFLHGSHFGENEYTLSLPPTIDSIHSRLMLGNGASELIDLVTRIAAPVGAFTLASSIQYKEYERAARADGRDFVGCVENYSPTKEASPKVQAFAQPATIGAWSMLAVINPCNPTGEYMSIEALKKYIEDAVTLNKTKGSKASCILVDESMQLWHGPGWRQDSLVSQGEWIRDMQDLHSCSIFLIHSWTKIWSCPGIRLGSILCPTASDASMLKRHQVPWSLNICALAFLESAVKDGEYLRQTWELTVSWRKQTEDKLKELSNGKWKVYGERWLSWLWVDTTCRKEAAQAIELARACGCPVRDGAMGYNMPTFIRLAVRAPEKQAVLFNAFKKIKFESKKN